MTGDDGVIRGPAGTGRVAAVAQDDIADVADVVLRSPAEHAGQTYDLTGPQALTLAGGLRTRRLARRRGQSVSVRSTVTASETR